MDILNLAKSVYIDFNDDELENVKSEFEKFQAQIEILDLIDTDGVDPMYYPFELNENSLRSDEVSSSLSKADVLSNAAEVKDDMIKIVKVVG